MLGLTRSMLAPKQPLEKPGKRLWKPGTEPACHGNQMGRNARRADRENGTREERERRKGCAREEILCEGAAVCGTMGGSGRGKGGMRLTRKSARTRK